MGSAKSWVRTSETGSKGRPYRGEDGRVREGDGSPHSRGQREGGKDIHPIPRLHGARLCARATGRGRVGREGAALRSECLGCSVGGGGEDHFPRLHEGKALTFPRQGGREKERWVVQNDMSGGRYVQNAERCAMFRMTWGGRCATGRMGGGGRAVGNPAFARGVEGGGMFTPSPRFFTRAGSNLPPSTRGKGFLGAERAVFIVMPGCDLGR